MNPIANKVNKVYRLSVKEHFIRIIHTRYYIENINPFNKEVQNGVLDKVNKNVRTICIHLIKQIKGVNQ